MAIPPPPYANITGTSQIIAKYNEQESIANVDGNARPGQLIVDLDVDPPMLYIGNVAGNISPVGGGGGGTGTLIFNGNDVYPNNIGYPHIWGGPAGGPEFSYLEQQGNLLSYSQTMYINASGLTVSLDYGNVELNYTPDGNLTVDGNIITTGSSGNITGANVIQTNTLETTVGIVNTASAPSSNGPINYTNIDNSGPTVAIANGDYLDIPNFSGMLLVNDIYDGVVAIWICGGNQTVQVSITSTGIQPTLGTMAMNGSGYRWTNNGFTGPFTFTVIKTRNGS